ncbi:MAG: ATP-binding protein [Bdellovibrionaceae bacterium]|nr:ATP-binding protein [Bdellovibrio sp.]
MEKTIKLNYINSLSSNLEKNNGLIQVLTGPRQVGKTTSILLLIDEHYKNSSYYVSADKVFNSDADWLTQQWIQAGQDKKILFIDEIQKCENWAEVIKKLYDENKRNKKPIRCVLLGSSSLEIQKGLTESLTGRFQQTHAYHWNFEESNRGYDVTFEDYLQYGGYPGSYNLRHQPDEWSAYVKNSIVNTVIEKDILQYQNVKSPALFRQAFEIIMGYPAQEISYTKLLGQIQDRGNVELIKNYLKLYEGAFLLRALEKFSAKIVKTKSSSPKILPLAPCFFQLTVQSSYNSDERGRAFEVVVGAQLCRTNESLYYWREGQHEVDFVLKKGKLIWAIEVKSNSSKSQKGLIAFKKQYPNAYIVTINPDNYFEFEKDPMGFLQAIAGA